MSAAVLAKIYTPIRIYLSSFRNKLVFSFLLLAIIPLILVGILSYTLSYKIARERILDTLSSSSSQLNETLANRFNQMDNASDAMQYYLYTLILQPSSSLTQQLEKYNSIKNYISNLQSTFDFFDISIYTKPEFLFSNQGINYFKLEELDRRGISGEFLSENLNRLHWGLFQNQKMPFMAAQSQEAGNYITAYSAFKRENSDQLEYVYFIDINQAEIARLLAEFSPHPTVKNYIVDQEGTIVSHSDRAALGTAIGRDVLAAIARQDGAPFLLDNRQFIVKHNRITDWYVITEFPTSYIKNNINILVNILLVTVLLVIIVSIVSSVFISNSLSTKIRKMSKVMSSLSLQDNNEKWLQTSIPVNHETAYRDEFDRLAIIFNSMIRKLNENFDQLLAFSLHEEKLRYQLLQSKINPHFLYNVLESIKTCQTLGRIDDANAMLSRLAKFYRMILKKGDDLITIQDEWEIAAIYLEMEQLNRNHAFAWTVEMDDQIGQFLIPKFTLQPILENCIHHGLSGAAGTMRIRISIRYENDRIVIQIADDGRGIPSDRLADIHESLRQKAADTNRFYGLGNVNMRLSLYSQDHPGVRIDSTEHAGTQVTLTLQQMIPDQIRF